MISNNSFYIVFNSTSNCIWKKILNVFFFHKLADDLLYANLLWNGSFSFMVFDINFMSVVKNNVQAITKI